MAEARVNLIINNLLVKQILATKDAHEDMRQKMLVQVAELLFTDDAPKTISTRRLAKIMVFSALLLRQVPAEKRAPYMMGSLFAMGGLLKIEARNFLETKLKYD